MYTIITPPDDVVSKMRQRAAMFAHMAKECSRTGQVCGKCAALTRVFLDVWSEGAFHAHRQERRER